MLRLVSPFISLLLVFSPLFFFGQTFSGLQTGKTLGIYNLDLQPASLVGQRANVDIQLFGFSSTLQNNYLFVNTASVRDGSVWSVDGLNYREVFPENLNGNEKNAFLNYDLYLPSVSIRLSPKRSLAFTGRLRNFVNLDQVGEPAARFAFLGLDVPDQFGISYNNDRFRFSLLSYVEFGLAWAETLYENGPHRINAGARIKFMSGLAGTYLYANRLEYSFTNADIINIHEADVDFAHSVALEGVEGGFNPLEDFDRLNLRNTGFGADLGAIYEYRPEGEDYRARLGLSILDIGNIRFEQSAFSQNFTGSVIGYDLSQLSLNGIMAFDSTLGGEFNYSSGETQFRMALPTVVSLQADFRLNKNVYISMIPFLALKGYNQPNRVHHISNFAITPRFEGKGWGIGIPFSLAGDRGTNVGATVRLGPLVAGSSNLLNFLLKENMRSADFHFGLHIPLAINKKDKTPEEETVPETTEPDPEPVNKPEEKPAEKPEKTPKEKAEKTPKEKAEKIPKEKPVKEVTANTKAVTSLEIPEPAANTPVVIPEKKPEPVIQTPPTAEAEIKPEPKPEIPEETAAEKAKKEAIARAEEKARMVAEEARLKREQEKQKELETQRKAREQALLSTDTELYKDRDNDGLADKYDQCPDVAGTFALAGCPEEEKIPEPGMDYSKGLYSTGPLSRHLPYADYDHDGVVNQDDRCPEIAGLKSHLGCPENDPRGKRILREMEIDAFERIYFESGSDHLTGNSRMILNRVADYLKTHPQPKMKFVGHADDIGSDTYNDDLSKRRSEAAIQYLVSKGIDQKRLSVEYFGKRLAVVPNTDEAARKKNRRVEIVLVAED
ncbi:MAG: DUF5723 family protein [Bacteroidia bacterium]|nr:DUF5723 family protein [Bacteroidia bacterium]